MFKNLILYRIAGLPELDLEALHESAKAREFVPCAPSQIRAIGWTPPRGDKNGAMVEKIGAQVVLRVLNETRSVPTLAVKEEVAKRLDKIQDETGRRPKGKAAKEIKEDVVHALLPRAFPRRSAAPVWIDPVRRTLAIGARNLKSADVAATMLVELFPGMSLQLVRTETAPALAMAKWLAEKEAPAGFSIDRECELKRPDSEKAAVKYSRHTLDTDEVAQHVKEGKVPTQLALTWRGRVSFVLTDDMVLKKVQMLEEIEKAINADGTDAFDADVVISTGELRDLFVELIDTLDGEVASDLVQEAAEEPGQPEAAPTPASAPLAQHNPNDGPDPLYDQAKAIVLEHRRVSISLVQRYLRIGYNRAARLIERMEHEHLVTTMDPRGNRDLLVPATVS